MKKRTYSKKGASVFAFFMVGLMFLSCVFSVMLDTIGATSIRSEASKGYTLRDAENVDYDFSGKLNQDAIYATNKIDDDERILAIIEVDGNSLGNNYVTYASAKYDTLGQYVASNSGRGYAANMQANQENLFNKLSREFDIEFKYSYTSILNAFAVYVRYGDVAAIEAFDKVQNVIISERFSAPETYASSGGVAENLVGIDPETGIYDTSDSDNQGHGTIVAVLDTGLDHEHSAFQNLKGDIDFSTPGKEGKYTPQDIQGKLDAEQFAAASFSSGLKAEDVYINEKVPYGYDYADKDAEVYPSDDHGTHVAGIIGGHDDNITGAAIGTQLAIMKVFSNNGGGCEEADVIAALEDSIRLDVDVINMSLGAASGFSRDKDTSRINEVYDMIFAAGVNLVIAAGNDYSSGFGSTYGLNLASNPDSAVVGSPSTYLSGISVASISGIKTNYLVAYGSTDKNDNPVNPLNIYYTVPADNNGEDILFMERLLKDAQGNDIKEKEFEYVVIPGLGTFADYVGQDVTGKIAVVKRGVDTFVSKIETAQAMGAIGCIIRNNVSGVIRMTLGTKPLIPACSIKMDFGNELYERSRASSAAGQGEGGFIRLSRDYLAGPFMSDFSSWGPSPNLDLKPEITAHGGNITSAVLGGGYDALSGTSMAAPNFAAVAALLRQHIIEHAADYGVEKTDTVAISALVNQIFMSTATIAINEDKNPYSPRKQGAGLADLTKSQNTSAYMYVKDANGNVSDKTKITIGDDKNRTGQYKLEFYIRNISQNQALTYNIDTIVMTEGLSSDERTVTELPVLLNDATKDVKVSGAGSYNKSKKTITVNAKGDAHVTVTVKLSKANKKYLDDTFKNGMFIEGFVELTPVTSGSSAVDLSIPYLGFYGDWSDPPMLDKTIYETSPDDVNENLQDHEKNKPDVKSVLPLAMATQDLGLARGDVEYIFFMGSPIFASADGFQDVAIEMDKSALSLGSSGMFMLYGVAGLLRNAKTVNISIKNAYTGQTMIQKAYQNGRKSTGFSYGAIEFNDEIDIKKFISDEGLRFVEGGKYTFEMECFLDWGDGKTYGNNNKFYFEFYVDSIAPEIKDVDVRIEKDRNFENERRYLDFEIYDAHYAASMDVLYYNPNTKNYASIYTGGMKPLLSERGGSLKTTVDITDCWQYIAENNYELLISLSDYAWNTSYQFLNFDTSYNAIKSLDFDSRYDANGLTISTYEEYELRNLLTVKGVKEDRLPWDDDYVWEVYNADGEKDESNVSVYMGKILGLAATDEPVTVRVSSKQNPSVYDEIKVSVLEKTFNNTTKISPKKLTLDNTSLSLSTGTNYEIKATVSPHQLSEEYKIVWSSNHTQRDAEYHEEEGIGWVNIAPKEGAPNDSVAIISVGGIFTEALEGFSRPTVRGVVHVLDEATGEWVATNAVATCYITVPETFVVTYHNLDRYNGNEEHVEIPGDLGIEAIGTFAFAANPFLKTVKIPEGVEKIDTAAFAYCQVLEEVYLPSTLTTIGERAFTAISNKDESGGYISALHTVHLNNPNGQAKLRVVGEKAFFNNNKLVNIDLTTVASIAPQAFFMCESLEVVNLPKCKDIGSAAFYQAFKLETLNLSQGVSIGELAFLGCESIVNLVLPAARVGLAAFHANVDYDAQTVSTGLKSVSFTSDTSVVIGDYAFFCSVQLETINFNDTVVKSIGAYAFMEAAITAITLPDGLEYMGDYAFAFSKLESIHISKGVKLENFGAETLQQTKVTQVTVDPENQLYSTDANNFALYSKDGTKLIFVVPNVYLSSISLSNVKHIAPYAFSANATAQAGQALTTLVLSSVETIGEGAFKNAKGLTRVYYTSALTSVGDAAFEGCTSLTVFEPSNGSTNEIKTIGKATFKNCSSLTSIALSSNITKIPSEAFFGTGALATVTFAGKVTEIGESAFEGSYVTNIDLSNVTKISNRAFARCSNLREVDLQNVVTIGDAAFERCTLLEINNLKSAKTIGAYAFAQAEAVTTASLPEVTFIGEGAFGATALYLKDESDGKGGKLADNTYLTNPSKANLTAVSMPKVERIESGAFRNTNLTSVLLPSTLKVMGAFVFSDCANLTRISVDTANKLFFDESGVLYSRVPRQYATFAANGTMDGYSDASYTLINYPMAKEFQKSNKGGRSLNFFGVKSGTTRIEAGAFRGTSLEWIDLPYEVMAIGHEAFFGCSNLQFVDFHSYAAPALETTVDVATELTVVASKIEGVNAYEAFREATANFSNFVFNANTATRPSVQVTYPSNGVNYNNDLYKKFFETLTQTSEVVMANATENFIKGVMELPQIKDLDFERDEPTIRSLALTLSLLSNEQKQLFVSSSIVNKLNEAVKWADEYKPGGNVNVGLVVGLSIGGTLLLLGAAAAVFFILKKKKMAG